MDRAIRRIDFPANPPESSSSCAEPHGMTLLDLIAVVSDLTENESQLVRVVRQMLRSGQVKLIGNFRGADVTIC